MLGTVSYYILPTLGPAFFQPSMFADLPDSGVSALQNALFKNGAAFKADPTGTDIYGIAGFASLHVSVVVTACLFFSAPASGSRSASPAGCSWLMTVLATVYFGWHYIADDVAGALIGWVAVSIGAWATGNRGRRKRRGWRRTTSSRTMPRRRCGRRRCRRRRFSVVIGRIARCPRPRRSAIS